MASHSGHGFDPFLDLGMQPISNSFPSSPWSPPAYRLTAGLEYETGLVRLKEQPKPQDMFHESYAFETRTSQRMIAHFEETAAATLKRVGSSAPRVIEIGSNDGVFLEACLKRGAQVLGVDPSSGVNAIAEEHGVRTREAFFTQSNALEIRQEEGAFDLAFAANALCHIPDFLGNLEGFSTVLADDGMLVFEDPYLGSVLERSTYDQFYDEHYYMFCATSVAQSARLAGLHLVDVEPLSTHGGSMRYYLKKRADVLSNRLNRVLEWEKMMGVTNLATLFSFADRVRESARFLSAQLEELAGLGRPVIGLAAASKTVTVLNFAGISSDQISFFADSTRSKAGRFMAGTDIIVVPQQEFTPPTEYVGFIGAHNHEVEILAALQQIGRAPEWVLSSVPFSTVRPVRAWSES